MKTCEQYEELVSAYVDGEATDEETTELFFHLGSCMGCRSFLTSVLRLNSFMLTNEPPLKNKTQQEAPRKGQPIWKRKFPIPLPVAAAAVVLMIISGTLLFTVTKTQTPTVIVTTQTEYVYMTTLVDVVASPLPAHKSN